MPCSAAPRFWLDGSELRPLIALVEIDVCAAEHSETRESLPVVSYLVGAGVFARTWPAASVVTTGVMPGRVSPASPFTRELLVTTSPALMLQAESSSAPGLLLALSPSIATASPPITVLSPKRTKSPHQ